MSNDKSKKETPVTRTHRSNDQLGIEKSNKAFTNIEKQTANLLKAKRNILLSGDKDLGKKFNFALVKFAETLTAIQIEDSEFDIKTPTKTEKPSFDLNEMEIED